MSNIRSTLFPKRTVALTRCISVEINENGEFKNVLAMIYLLQGALAVPLDKKP
jgi:hypothetical protein